MFRMASFTVLPLYSHFDACMDCPVGSNIITSFAVTFHVNVTSLPNLVSLYPLFFVTTENRTSTYVTKPLYAKKYSTIETTP